MPVIEIVACLLTDPAGRMLLVRKRQTTAFMQPGGKPEAGEAPADALVRELAEELQLTVAADEVRHLGRFGAPAANEPGHDLDVHAFALQLDQERAAAVQASAEIAEAVWVAADAVSDWDLAPLTRQEFLPRLGSVHPS